MYERENVPGDIIPECVAVILRLETEESSPLCIALCPVNIIRQHVVGDVRVRVAYDSHLAIRVR